MKRKKDAEDLRRSESKRKKKQIKAHQYASTKQQGHHVCEVPKPKRYRKTKDRLSSLPDEILIQILSLSPIRTAIFTEVLSCRWRNLWTQITSVVLEENVVDISHLKNFTEHFLQRLTSPTFNIVKFRFISITSDNFEFLLHDYVRRIDELKVRELHISSHDFSFKCPRSMLRASSLVSLHLGSSYHPICLYNDDSDFVELPKLRKLNIFVKFSSACGWNSAFDRNSAYDWNSAFGYSSVEKILRSCPILENLCIDLFLIDTPEPVVFHMYSKSLRLLNINGYRSFCKQRPVTVVVETPNLESFTFSTCTGIKCRFEAKPISLRKADLSVNSGYSEVSMMTEILELYRSISDVRFLTLNSTQLVASSTMFPNLTYLTLTHLYPFAWKRAMDFLIQCPNLRELTLRTHNCHEYEEEIWGQPKCIPPCLLTHVKRIEIEIALWEKKLELHLLTLVKTLLSCANMLEHLIIIFVGLERDYVRNMYKESEHFRFFRCYKSSSKCRIDIYGILRIMGKEEKVWALKNQDGMNDHQRSK